MKFKAGLRINVRLLFLIKNTHAAIVSDLKQHVLTVIYLYTFLHLPAYVKDVDHKRAPFSTFKMHRLLGVIEDVRKADVVIAVAGMEGALPSVVSGLVASPVVAVPTSVGYGAGAGGVAAALAMLNSCAEGVSVVNIDNGFGAAVVACRMLRRMKGKKV